MMIGRADQCINRCPSILPQFGISPSYLTGKHTPCPTCGGKDRFRFDNNDGRGTYNCNKCGPGDGVQLVMMKTGWPFRQAAEKIRKIGRAPVGTPATNAHLVCLLQLKTKQ